VHSLVEPVHRAEFRSLFGSPCRLLTEPDRQVSRAKLRHRDSFSSAKDHCAEVALSLVVTIAAQQKPRRSRWEVRWSERRAPWRQRCTRVSQKPPHGTSACRQL